MGLSEAVVGPSSSYSPPRGIVFGGFVVEVMVFWWVDFLRCGWFGKVVFGCWDAIEGFETNVRVRHCDITPSGKLLLYLGDIAGSSRTVLVHAYLCITGVFLSAWRRTCSSFPFCSSLCKGRISVGPLSIMMMA